MNVLKNPLWALLRDSGLPKGKIAWAMSASILNKLCDIVPEILIGIAIDVIVRQEQSVVAQLGVPDPVIQLYLVGGLTALLWILESVFEYQYSIAWRSLAHIVQHETRMRAYARLQAADLTYFETKTTGELVTIVHDDVNQLEQFLSQGPNDILQLLVNIIAMGAIFFYVAPILALMVLFPIPFVVGIAFYFQHKIAQAYRFVRDASAAVASHIAYRLQGITTIRSYVTQDYEQHLLHQESMIYRQAHEAAHGVYALYVPLVRMAIMVGFIMTLVVGGLYVLQGKLPINWYASLVFLTQRFLWPFTTLTTITDMYERAVACARRIMSVLEAPISIRDGSLVIPQAAVHGAVSFSDIYFSYAPGVTIFDGFSVAIPARQTVAFVGATGSGKSTLMKLLLRLYDADKGVITLDGHAIKDFSLADLRSHIGFVGQEVYLVAGTIADNIAYGSPHATQADIEQAARMAQADAFIRALPDGYQTVVQEYGKNLSGGQRQRLSIARALLKKAPILLFDEATAALDNETEAAMQESLRQLAHKHTIIMIAHRLSTVRHADTIFVLDKGVIVEQGNHETLLSRGEVYARLWRLQG